MEGFTKPTAGHWYWKEESNTLEFLSYDGAADIKDKPKKSKAIHFQEVGRKGADSAESKLHAGVKSSMVILKTLGPAKPSDGTFSGLTPKSTRSVSKRDQDGSVTLDDVKQVALSLLNQHAVQELPSFSAIIRSQHLDDFLMALLFYLSCYLNKTSLEQKPKSIMAKCSATDRKEMADVVFQTELAKKHLAHMYGILVLGWTMPRFHHMACGKSRGSATHKDRTFFEYLYSFCTHLAWVTFLRKDLDVIQEEVGRLLRSNTFNFVLREKSVPEDQETKVPVEKKKKSQRERRIGIIGQPRRMFNSFTLLPLEIEEAANSRNRSSASFYSFGLDASYRPNTRSGLSQQSTAVSRATTEGGYSENEL
ncbi:protein phosphatase 1 regulatory subunit 36 isoform X2 [Microcaecilia unicolor]|uniref:Protein phosphatase 1 regulatory subunit 36 isoform X2 n=1 Tax=Microcaecilia unicolor TaxID=1415580 RepID=A0A6P7Z1A0_9AMPH|nr:protein phosphatase 1 regulatory subunit 36 isoform X2 [Microcaecilia unicolor]